MYFVEINEKSKILNNCCEKIMFVYTPNFKF